MQIKSFRDLRVWQGGIELVKYVYETTSNFPRSEVYALASQMQRAAVSVPSNIAEGHARESTKEYLQHLSIAQASLAELETQLEIASQLNYVSENNAKLLIGRITALGRQLFALRNALKNPKAKAASPGS
jgi:four helix bundle protein